MDEKVWKEFCEDCGCPLDICCKPKKPVVSVEWLEKWCKEHKSSWVNHDLIEKEVLLKAVRLQAKAVGKKE